MTKNYIKFKNRIIFIHIAIMFVWIGFAFRLFNIQIINKMDNPQGIKVETVKGLRGNFYDVNLSSTLDWPSFYKV
jgi:Cell division protein FtsI/penicillin-binding protein 2